MRDGAAAIAASFSIRFWHCGGASRRDNLATTHRLRVLSSHDQLHENADHDRDADNVYVDRR